MIVMKTNSHRPTAGKLTSILKPLLLLCLTFLLNSVQAQTQKLPAPTVSSEPSCGATNVVLKANSTVVDDNLIFTWYDKNLQVLGQEAGPNGSNEFITPYLTKNESFFVSIELNGISSEIQEVKAEIIHTPSVLEDPIIELCGSAMLTGSIQLFDEFDNVFYQWQRLTAKDEVEVVFQDLEGETAPNLTVEETGIFRLVVSLDDCIAISDDVEVTTELVAEATPIGSNHHCYTVDSPDDDIATFSSQHYRPGITTATWYQSNDGGVSYSIFISEGKFASIEKPSEIIDTDEPRYYRLILMEQNCSDQADFIINWNAKPRGSIQHKNGTTDNFFYCEDDAAETRTLEAISDDNVQVTWHRYFDTTLSRNTLFSLSSLITVSELLLLNNFNSSLVEIIGSGNEIILDQSMGGLIFAKFLDLDNGCESYSSNIMFADTAFPFPVSLLDAEATISEYPYNGVCLGMSNLTMSSWDPTPDNFSWHYSEENLNYTQVGSSETYLMNSIDNPGDVEGFYTLGVEKNGCYAESDPFFIFEHTPTESIIEASSTEFCQESNILLSSVNQSLSYSYEWYNTDDLDSVLSDSVVFTPEVAGSYILTLYNGFCISVSDPISINQLPIPEANFSTPASTEEAFCTTIHAELIAQNTDDTYEWFQSTNNFNFTQISDEGSLDYLITNVGFYFATVTNAAGCQTNSDTLHIADLLDDELNYNQAAYICDNSDGTALWLKAPQSNQVYQWQYSPDNINDYTAASGTNHLAVYQATELGYYRLEVTGEKCSLITDPIEVLSDPDQSGIEPIIMGDEQACSGTPITLTDDSSGDLLASYIWLYSAADGELLPFIGEQQKTLLFDAADFTSDANPIQEINIYLGITEGNCSSISKPATIQAIKKPDVIVRNEITNTTEDIFICDLRNTEVVLEAFQVPANRSIDYQWSVFNPTSSQFDTIQNDNLKVLNIAESGVYQCIGTVPGTTCSATSNTLEVSSPPYKLIGDSTYCYGNFFEVQVDQGYSFGQTFNSFSYQWYYSNDDLTYTAIDTTQASSLTLQSGDDGVNGGYFYYIASYNSCDILSDTSYVEEDEGSVRITIEGTSIQEKGVPFQLSASPTQDINPIAWEPSEYLVSPSANYTIFTIPEDYSENQIDIIASISNERCTSLQHFLVSLLELESLEFSKIITPNGDNYNDFFRVKIKF